VVPHEFAQALLPALHLDLLRFKIEDSAGVDRFLRYGFFVHKDSPALLINGQGL
jgi:hypothetical protein